MKITVSQPPRQWPSTAPLPFLASNLPSLHVFGRRVRWAHTLELAALMAVLAITLTFRVTNLAEPNDNYDEGVYLESLLLMKSGYRPFADIVSTQGPLHLPLAYISYALGGQSLAAARAGAAAASVVAILGAAWAGRSLAGPIAGLVAAFALGLSPTFLNVSRQSLPEAPAVAIAVLAVGAAAQAHRTGSDRWRMLAGLLLGLACLVKPLVASTAIPVLVFTAHPRSWRSWLLASFTAAAVVLFGFGLTGLGSAGNDRPFQSVIGWRVASNQFELSAAGHNAALLVDKMFHQEQAYLYTLAAYGAVTLGTMNVRPALALAGWFLCTLASLLVYTALGVHLGSTLMAPLALLAGAGTALTIRAWRQRPISLVAVAGVLVIVGYAAAVPGVLNRDQRLAAGLLSTDRDGSWDELAAASAIARETEPADFVLTDEPYLAFLADRRVPPSLVDPSQARIQAGALTSAQLDAVLRQYDPDVIVLWRGRFAGFDLLSSTLPTQFDAIEDFGPDGKGSRRAVYRDRFDDD